VRPVAVVGNVALDRIAGAQPRIGGAPYYAARALRLLGSPARLLVKCAPEDRAGIVPALAALGVPVAWRDGSRTAAYSFSYRDGVRSMSVDALGDPWTPADIGDATMRAEWVHIGALYASEYPHETLAALARRSRVLFDGQGLVRPAETGPLHLRGEPDPELLRHVTALKLAEEEAGALLGELTEANLRALAVPEVLVTFGERGAWLLAGGRFERVVARPIAALDPTGAGDAFAAAYAVARSGGHSPTTAARRATALVASMLVPRRR
jgi:sugar/nucleoside kinase (ribokinase family)